MGSKSQFKPRNCSLVAFSNRIPIAEIWIRKAEKDRFRVECKHPGTAE